MVSKEDIIAETFNLFAEYGYYTTLDDIAEKVKLKRQSLYSHFSSKDEIIWLTIEQEVNRYYGSLNFTIDSVKDKPIENQLKTIYLSVFEYFTTLETIRFWRNINLIQNIDLRNRCNQLIRSKYEFSGAKVLEYFNTAYTDGSIRKGSQGGCTYLYQAMINGVLDACLLYGQFDKEYILATWETYWSGIKSLA